MCACFTVSVRMDEVPLHEHEHSTGLKLLFCCVTVIVTVHLLVCAVLPV